MRHYPAIAVLPLLCLGFAGCRPSAPAAGPVNSGAPVNQPVSTAHAPASEQTVECQNEKLGFRVRYPAGWHANGRGPLPACSVFDPQPVQLPEASEVPYRLAVAFRIDERPFDVATGIPAGVEVLKRADLTVDGQPARLLETRQSEDHLPPQGGRAYRYFVNLGGRTLIASTYDIGELDYATKRGVLDRMLGTLKFTEKP